MMAKLTLQSDADRGDEQFRNAIAGYRKVVEQLKGTKREPGIGPVHNEEFGLAGRLQDTALAFETRHPDEAEALRDEAIAVMKALNGPSPAYRAHLQALIEYLAHQARFLRRLAATQPNQDPDKIAQRLKKAGDLFLEAISLERLSVSRFLLPASRHSLVNLLREEAQFLLGPFAEKDGTITDPAARKLQADAHLTEAIQLCRGLAAEFPDNADYKNRLADLERLHAQHFGQKKEGDQ